MDISLYFEYEMVSRNNSVFLAGSSKSSLCFHLLNWHLGSETASIVSWLMWMRNRFWELFIILVLIKIIILIFCDFLSSLVNLCWSCVEVWGRVHAEEAHLAYFVQFNSCMITIVVVLCIVYKSSCNSLDTTVMVQQCQLSKSVGKGTLQDYEINSCQRVLNVILVDPLMDSLSSFA